MSRNMEEVVIVDLDDDKVIPPGKDTDAVLLPPFVAPLRATIEEISRRVRTRVTLTQPHQQRQTEGWSFLAPPLPLC